MEPIAVTVRGERRWVLVHRCTHCGRLRLNRTAADDNVLLLLRLAALPLSLPPLPYDHEAAVPGPRSGRRGDDAGLTPPYRMVRPRDGVGAQPAYIGGESCGLAVGRDRWRT